MVQICGRGSVQRTASGGICIGFCVAQALANTSAIAGRIVVARIASKIYCASSLAVISRYLSRASKPAAA